jgi:eukaryotic-like serine/threonine-protein kinase
LLLYKKSISAYFYKAKHDKEQIHLIQSNINEIKGTHGTIEFLLRRMRHKGDLPAFSQHIVEINKKLSSLHSINFSSSGELANVILKDISLTNKLLRVVNSSLYGNLSGKVTTISRAVFLLGAEKVRIAAASLMIMDHLQNKSQAAELKDAALISFFSSVIARNVAEKMMFHTTEEVFICTLLHNLGKHLVICYFPEEYNEIKNIIATKGSDEQSASKMVLGVSYSELGKGIGKSWGFPETIINSMDIISEAETKSAENETDLLKSIANYASELCAVAAQADDMKRDEAMQAVCSKYKLTVSFPVNRTITMIEDAATKIDKYAEMFNINKSRNPLLQRLKSYGEEKALPGESSGSNVPDASSGMAMSLRTETIKRLSRAEEQSEMLKNCITEINEMLNSQSSISDAIYMILETMYRGFEFNRVLFCMVDQSHAKMAARFGFGENIDNILDQFQFKITRSSDFFNIAVMRMKDFIVDDSHAAGIRENLPGWYLKIINAHSFLIYPLIIKEKCIGMFYADKKTSRMLDNDQRDYINILRDKTIWAMLHKH